MCSVQDNLEQASSASNIDLLVPFIAKEDKIMHKIYFAVTTYPSVEDAKLFVFSNDFFGLRKTSDFVEVSARTYDEALSIFLRNYSEQLIQSVNCPPSYYITGNSKTDQFRTVKVIEQ